MCVCMHGQACALPLHTGSWTGVHAASLSWAEKLPMCLLPASTSHGNVQLLAKTKRGRTGNTTLIALPTTTTHPPTHMHTGAVP